MSKRTFMQQLEAHDNELEVRERIATDQYNKEHLGIALEWLRRKDEKRAAEAAARSEEREEESLSTAKEANRIASDALAIARTSCRWAMWATIIAIIAIIIAIKDQIFALIFNIT